MTRKVVTRNPHREVGVVNPGWLLDHPVEHESHLERRFVIAALACPVVKDIVHQPLELILMNGTKEESYTPDFKIVFRDGGVLIVEVKPKVFIAKHEDKFKRAKERLLADGYRFLVITDEMIDGQALAARALLLMRYGRLRFTDEQALECLKEMRERCSGSATVKALVETGLSEALIWNLVARHKCRVPADFLVEPEQVIFIETVEGDNHDYFKSWFGASPR
ncbi:TnsA endonuclease N-terminal domain-containing protein [Acidovorax sp.]|uniref:TnsA endonuclease N-terminal domain-containing protein n=1 Tax=Acidovorax sp. TaxID=1872122 RepID=UPI002ACF025E|nr:TnsA endonuclease N-terminal domain-containing protein [Acidovorax sp.]MDZ7865945.1 TnsA endonuclease N-terminal domain-containing protein [Acidovorax sp.]